jgi:hypothetical protein
MPYRSLLRRTSIPFLPDAAVIPVDRRPHPPADGEDATLTDAALLSKCLKILIISAQGETLPAAYIDSVIVLLRIRNCCKVCMET